MAYDFDKVINRQGTSSSKWDNKPGNVSELNYKVDEALPLWVADMDFETAPEITAALLERVKHGIFGYTMVSDSCYDAIIEWEKERHGFDVKREWILFAPGAVPAVHMSVQAYCQTGDHVIVQRPVYYPFFRTIYNNGASILNNPLKLNGDNYEIDFDDLEKKASDPRASLFILCSPHNPVGRVWSASDLEKMGDICARNDVLVVSDELHCDLIMPGNHHTPFASINERCRENSVIVIAPSKTFNLAGLQATVVIIPNRRVRQRFQNILTQNSIPQPNLLALTAMETGYRHGAKWLGELLAYIQENYDFMVKYLTEKLPKAKPFKMEGTYLAWIDFRALESDPDKLQKRMLTEAKVWLDEGKIFGPEGNGFERIVLACPRSILKDALDRVVRAFA
ncbi:cystathionine beta-lyase [Synergistales bacterium]|nr:cystathionine beta-lyase [Synergistales bacterium]